MGRKKGWWGILIALFLLVNTGMVFAEEEVIYEEGFETGMGGWYPDNGVWDLCLHTPPNPPWGGGLLYVATVCGGNYPTVTDSRLISPSIILPVITGDEELHLRFMQWFSYEGGDYGYVQISVYDEASGSWSPFSSINGATGNTSSVVWSPQSIDITAYAGKKVRIGFWHYTDNDSGIGAGWFIDDLEIIKKVPELTWDFECGWDDWYTGNGVWEVGVPTYGPSACYSGEQCAGTILGGKYPTVTDSRLVSPSFYLSIDVASTLCFRHWFSYEGGDYGYVHLSVFDESSQKWSAWQDISGPVGPGPSAGWTLRCIDLSAHTGEKVRIAFSHQTDNDSGTGAGWYIDHVRIAGLPHFCDCDLNQDTLCDMQDWLVFGSDWGRTDCNEVDVQPCECDHNHDGSCNMLDWLRFGENWGQSDCLICEQ